MFKSFIQKRLEKYVKKYLKNHQDIKFVAVAGSVGKTTTKIAIATILSEKMRVRVHEGNHNTNLSAPLAIMGIDYPENIKSLLAWLTVFRAAKMRIKLPSDVDVIIQELGSDRIGQTAQFAKYLKPDIGVVTAVSPEHMEFFKTIDAVAQEELMIANFSKIALINRDDIGGEFAKYLTNSNVDTYGTNSAAEYHFIAQNFSFEKGYEGNIFAPEWPAPIYASVNILGDHSLRAAVAATAVAIKFGLSPEAIVTGLLKIHPVAGRMNILRGADDTMIIDDTYNSSPLAAEAALRVLYQMNTPKRIAVLGGMNELGEVSAVEHEKIGKMCDPSQLAWVITVGDEAEKYLAPAARARGCQVKSFKTALQAGGFVRSVLEQGAVILFKGSEGGIYLEEAIKEVLHATEEEKSLVRQSSEWLAKKMKFFEVNN